MELITFGDAKASFMVAAFLTGIGALLSGIVYCMMVFPWMRREEFRAYEGFSKRSGAIAGLLILLAFASGGYYAYLSPFFEIRLDHSQIELLYCAPSRTVTLAREDIHQIVRRSEPTKSGAQVSLRILTRSGQRYNSARLNPRDFEVAFKRLEQWLVDEASLD